MVFKDDYKRYLILMFIVAVIPTLWVFINSPIYAMGALRYIVLSLVVMVFYVVGTKFVNKIYGIDGNWRLDVALGVFMGLGFIILNILSPNFVIGIPNALFSTMDDVSKFILVAGAASLIEEGLFRGVIMAVVLTASKKLGAASIIISIFIQAFLFSIFHYLAYGSGAQTYFVGAMVFGLVAGIITYKTQSIMPSSIGHFLFNSWIYGTQTFSIGVI